MNDVFQSRDGKIWYATDKGVSVYDAQTRLWHHGLYNKVALTICQTVDGRILVGTYGNRADASNVLLVNTRVIML